MESELFLSHFHHTSDLLDKFCSTVILLDFCNILNYNFDKTILQIHIFAFLLGMELVLFLYYFHHTRALLDKFCSEMILSESCNIHHYNLNNTNSQIYLDMSLLGMELVLFRGRFHHTNDLLDKLCSKVTPLDYFNIQDYNPDRTILQIWLNMFPLGMELVLFLGH